MESRSDVRFRLPARAQPEHGARDVRFAAGIPGRVHHVERQHHGTQDPLHPYHHGPAHRGLRPANQHGDHGGGTSVHGDGALQLLAAEQDSERQRQRDGVRHEVRRPVASVVDVHALPAADRGVRSLLLLRSTRLQTVHAAVLVRHSSQLGHSRFRGGHNHRLLPETGKDRTDGGLPDVGLHGARTGTEVADMASGPGIRAVVVVAVVDHSLHLDAQSAKTCLHGKVGNVDEPE